MTTLIITVIILLVAVLLMAIGTIVSGRNLKGSCGGTGKDCSCSSVEKESCSNSH